MHWTSSSTISSLCGSPTGPLEVRHIGRPGEDLPHGSPRDPKRAGYLADSLSAILERQDRDPCGVIEHSLLPSVLQVDEIRLGLAEGTSGALAIRRQGAQSPAGGIRASRQRAQRVQVGDEDLDTGGLDQIRLGLLLDTQHEERLRDHELAGLVVAGHVGLIELTHLTCAELCVLDGVDQPQSASLARAKGTRYFIAAWGTIRPSRTRS